MGVLVLALVIAALFALAARAPLWIVTGNRPTDRPREWPVGVQEGDPVGYAVGSLAPRVPQERPEPVPTVPVGGHVSPRA